jgi:acyl dehydratase
MAPATALRFEDVDVGAELPAIELAVTYQRIVMNAGVTWDWFPGHHDPEYAREQGQETIYLSTQFFTGFADRCATEWGGPDTFIRRRRIAMRQAIYAGQTAAARGRVVGKRDEDGRRLVDLEVQVLADGTTCVDVELTVELSEDAPA